MTNDGCKRPDYNTTRPRVAIEAARPVRLVFYQSGMLYLSYLISITGTLGVGKSWRLRGV